MLKIYKLMFSSMLMIGTLISISAYSWMSMWMGLEINLLAMIPIMQIDKNTMSTESSIKYFIVQAMASTIILMSVITSSLKMTIMFIDSSPLLLMNFSLLLKMGMAPLHFWFPEVLEGLSWMNCIIMLTWQKLAPMILLSYIMKFSKLMFMIIISGMLISSILSFNQISMRKLMAYSSINHMSWMISSMLLSKTIWLIYFLVYSLLTFNILMMLNYYKVFYINQLFQTMNNSMMMKFLFTMNFLSLSGIPPFIGFLPKWLTIQVLINQKMYLLTLIMITMTLVMIFIYLRISISAMIFSINEQNWKLNMNNKTSIMLTINFLIIVSLMLVTLMFNMT